jgi:hypothetical protein
VIIKYLIIAALWAFFGVQLGLSYCQAGEWYVEIGVGKNDVFDVNGWEGRESTACMGGFGWMHRKEQWAIDINYRHSSQCTRGNGFDSRDENTLDNIGVYGRYYF